MPLRTRWFPRTEGLANALELSESGVVSPDNAIVVNHGLSRRGYYTLYDNGKTNSQAHRFRGRMVRREILRRPLSFWGAFETRPRRVFRPVSPPTTMRDVSPSAQASPPRRRAIRAASPPQKRRRAPLAYKSLRMNFAAFFTLILSLHRGRLR